MQNNQCKKGMQFAIVKQTSEEVNWIAD